MREARGLADDIGIYPIMLDGQNDLLCPSLAVLQHGRLYFGFEAEKRRSETGALVFSHLKVCLACEAEESRQPLSDCRSDCLADGRCRGTFPQKCKASELTICFLAWVMREARHRLPSDLGNPEEQRFTYNLGVPLAQLDLYSPLREAYRRVGFHAWLLSEGMSQGIELEKVLSWIGEIKNRGLPSADQSLVQLCTEAGAAIVSCLASPDMLPGMYGLIDVGAWTTDISFFRRVELTISPYAGIVKKG